MDDVEEAGGRRNTSSIERLMVVVVEEGSDGCVINKGCFSHDTAATAETVKAAKRKCQGNRRESQWHRSASSQQTVAALENQWQDFFTSDNFPCDSLEFSRES